MKNLDFYSFMYLQKVIANKLVGIFKATEKKEQDTDPYRNVTVPERRKKAVHYKWR
jgi:hypothetical protein